MCCRSDRGVPARGVVASVLTDDVRQEAPLTAMFEDDIVIYSESREWVGRKPRSLRNEGQQEQKRIDVCK